MSICWQRFTGDRLIIDLSSVEHLPSWMLFTQRFGRCNLTFFRYVLLNSVKLDKSVQKLQIVVQPINVLSSFSVFVRFFPFRCRQAEKTKAIKWSALEFENKTCSNRKKGLREKSPRSKGATGNILCESPAILL